jgi:ribonuclease P protein component
MLPKERRITRTKDWQRLRRFGRTIHSPEITLKLEKNSLQLSRFGFVVSTKTSKKATQRNKIKRRARAVIIQEWPHVHEGYDVVFVVHPPATSKTFIELRTIILSLLDRAKLISRKI